MANDKATEIVLMVFRNEVRRLLLSYAAYECSVSPQGARPAGAAVSTPGDLQLFLNACHCIDTQPALGSTPSILSDIKLAFLGPGSVWVSWHAANWCACLGI